MQTARIVSALLTTMILAASAVARAETAAESFASGEKSLVKGEFERALRSYAAAARADRNNQEYLQHYAMVRRIVDLRSRLEGERNRQQWEYMARALRSFYCDERIYHELLKLDQAIHAKLNSAESAAFLAETQLAMHQDAAAVQTLSALEPGKSTAMTQVLLGLALVRTGKAAEARQIAESLRLPDDAGPSVTYAAARLHAATGASAAAMALLKTCFERTLPSQLEGFKSHAKTCPEFAEAASGAAFAGVMEVKSKIPESKCSGGSSCAGCPMRGNCPMSQGKR